MAILLPFTILTALFHINEMPLRLFGLSLLAPVLFHRFLTQRWRIEIFFTFIFLAGFFLIHIILHEDFTSQLSYIFIPFTGFVVALVLASVRIELLELEKIYRIINVGVILFAFINIFFIYFTPQPWISIALFTGQDVTTFSHLYNRILMPFGTPQQLGFVATCLVIVAWGQSFVKSSGNRAAGLRTGSTLFALIVIILSTGSVTTFLPLAILITNEVIYLFLARSGRVLFFALIALSIISLAATLVMLLDINLAFRGAENVSESMSRHVMLREQTIAALLASDVKTLPFGVGAGLSPSYIDGRYSFTVLLTALFELGIFGFFVHLFYFMALFKMAENRFSFYIALLTFMSSLFYQVNMDLSFYAIPVVFIRLLNYKFSKVSEAKCQIALSAL